jgi:hypothetical protein
MMSGSAIDKPRDITSGHMGTVAEYLHDLTAERFLRLGVSSVVYPRSGMADGDVVCAIFSADGALMSVVEDIETAMALASEHGMTVVTVH